MPAQKIAIVYTLKGCPWCVKVKQLLRAKNYKIKERLIHRGDRQLTLPDGRTQYTYPQVFFAIGGYTDTEAFLARRR